MGIDFHARDFFHPFGIWRLHRALERSQWFCPSQIAERQDGMLRRMVRHAYDNVPYYRDLFDSRGLAPGDIRGTADLACLPRINKTILRREYLRLRATNSEKFGGYPVQTSGTTGEAVRFMLDRTANNLEFAYYWRWFGWSGYRLGHCFAELSAAYFLHRPQCVHQPYVFQRHCNRLLLNCMESSPGRTTQFAAAIRRYRPRYLKGMPSAVSQMAVQLRVLGIDDVCFKAVFCNGEMLLPSTRRLIQETLHSAVSDSYGQMERTIAICECPAGSLHVNPEYGVLEIVDEEVHGGSATRRGLAIGTGLHCFAMPLLRYETGDVIEYSAQPGACECGRAMPRVLRIEGRLDDGVLLPDGRLITTLFLVIDKAVGIRRGQIVQDRLDHLLVRIAPAEDWSAEREQVLLRDLRLFVGSLMGITVHCEPEGALRPAPGRKWRTVISQVTAAKQEA